MFYDRRYSGPVVSDFMWMSNQTLPPFLPITWLGASLDAELGELNHPGVVRIMHGTNANAGGGIGLWSGISGEAGLLCGGETLDLIFSIPTTNNAGNLTTARIGFHDANNNANYVDAAIIYVNGNTLDGRTSSNNVGSTTGNNYTIAANTWYRGMVKIADGVNRVDFKLWAENGTLLWSNNLTTNVPSNRTLAVISVAFNPQAGSTLPVIAFDWMCYYSTRMLIR